MHLPGPEPFVSRSKIIVGDPESTRHLGACEMFLVRIVWFVPFEPVSAKPALVESFPLTSFAQRHIAP